MARVGTEILCRGILFDLDGVLVDSTPAVARVWRGWALEHGFDPEEVVRAAHGRPSLATIREYLPGANHEAENREVERRELADLDGVVALPGAVELLRALAPECWAIVTSCTRTLAEVRIHASGAPRPRFLVSSDDVRNGKPSPEPYLHAAELLCVPARRCVVVEDAPAGVRAGKAAGCRVVALGTTMPAAEMQEAGADWLIKNCGAISVISAASENGIRLALETSSEPKGARGL